jgi:hypothetical protein
MGWVCGALLCVFALIDRHHGDGALSANIEMAAGYICFAIASHSRTQEPPKC